MSRLPPRIVPAIIEFAYGDLARKPGRVGKALERDLSGSFSTRRGPYRVLYDLDDAAGAVQILRVDHRTEFYRPR